nr:ArsR family transcriptional regulator [Eggerthellaceae bacterium]
WGGACVGTIQEKSGLSQSTVSSYLASMQQAGLLESMRYEKWTYYRLNERAVQQLQSFISAWRQP